MVNMLTVACQDVNSVTNHSFIDVSILRLICLWDVDSG